MTEAREQVRMVRVAAGGGGESDGIPVDAHASSARRLAAAVFHPPAGRLDDLDGPRECDPDPRQSVPGPQVATGP